MLTNHGDLASQFFYSRTNSIRLHAVKPTMTESLDCTLWGRLWRSERLDAGVLSRMCRPGSNTWRSPVKQCSLLLNLLHDCNCILCKRGRPSVDESTAGAGSNFKFFDASFDSNSPSAVLLNWNIDTREVTRNSRMDTLLNYSSPRILNDNKSTAIEGKHSLTTEPIPRRRP